MICKIGNGIHYNFKDFHDGSILMKSIEIAKRTVMIAKMVMVGPG